ncbi:ParB/RepB/Spo0J family partition protein [Nioella nitratireducens]|uniref:ParB/RepB/Spo0J family partition protein n=1 Tax=Nioella nitratireducens TaxID=1287720 RepID=UPI0008FD860A|nr:ParB/RepB/Spo0J family partition protein [Nioella nitratireducens]
MAKQSRGLGRGLSALMADINEPTASSQAEMPQPARADRTVPIESVRPNPEQPRRAFTQDALQELSDSIAEKGIIQPLIVRPDPAMADMFQIVAGERRWRAAQMAQLHEVPVIVRNFNDTEVLEVAIIENIQRADLNPVEEAMGYRQLMDRFNHTQERLAEAMGKSRPHIANLLRLLTLPEEVQGYLRDGKLTAGHARALVGSDRAAEIARDVVNKGLSVREVERRMKHEQGQSATPTGRPAPGAGSKDADTKALEGDLSAAIGLTVTIEHHEATGGGKLSIKYDDLAQLDDLIKLLNSGS